MRTIAEIDKELTDFKEDNYKRLEGLALYIKRLEDHIKRLEEIGIHLPPVLIIIGEDGKELTRITEDYVKMEKYYGADSEKELIGGSVPATEHSVACMNIEEIMLSLEKTGEWDGETETRQGLVGFARAAAGAGRAGGAG